MVVCCVGSLGCVKLSVALSSGLRCVVPPPLQPPPQPPDYGAPPHPERRSTPPAPPPPPRPPTAAPPGHGPSYRTPRTQRRRRPIQMRSWGLGVGRRWVAADPFLAGGGGIPRPSGALATPRLRCWLDKVSLADPPPKPKSNLNNYGDRLGRGSGVEERMDGCKGIPPLPLLLEGGSSSIRRALVTTLQRPDPRHPRPLLLRRCQGARELKKDRH